MRDGEPDRSQRQGIAEHEAEDVAARTASGNGVDRHAARFTDYRQARRGYNYGA